MGPMVSVFSDSYRVDSRCGRTKYSIFESTATENSCYKHFRRLREYGNTVARVYMIIAICSTFILPNAVIYLLQNGHLVFNLHRMAPNQFGTSKFAGVSEYPFYYANTNQGWAPFLIKNIERKLNWNWNEICRDNHSKKFRTPIPIYTSPIPLNI